MEIGTSPVRRSWPSEVPELLAVLRLPGAVASAGLGKWNRRRKSETQSEDAMAGTAKVVMSKKDRMTFTNFIVTPSK